MNKKIIILCIAIIIAIGGGLLYLLNNPMAKQEQANGNAVNTPAAQAPAQTVTPAETSPATTTEAGKYIGYRSDAISSTRGTKLLFFHAPWCPQCRDLEADIKQKGVPSGVTIIKVDYDTNQQLRQKYGVTLQTTIVKVDDAGQLVDKFVAYNDPSLSAIVNKLL